MAVHATRRVAHQKVVVEQCLSGGRTANESRNASGQFVIESPKRVRGEFNGGQKVVEFLHLRVRRLDGCSEQPGESDFECVEVRPLTAPMKWGCTSQPN